MSPPPLRGYLCHVPAFSSLHRQYRVNQFTRFPGGLTGAILQINFTVRLVIFRHSQVSPYVYPVGHEVEPPQDNTTQMKRQQASLVRRSANYHWKTSTYERVLFQWGEYNIFNIGVVWGLLLFPILAGTLSSGRAFFFFLGHFVYHVQSG